MKHLRIGVTGYSPQKFDEDKARGILSSAFSYLEAQNNPDTVEIVSGLTNMGIPMIAYQLAAKYEYSTVGIACSKALDMECWPVDQQIIVGDEWGDETDTFLLHIDILIRVGGGTQARAEVDLAKKLKIATMEFDLPSEEEE